MKITKTNRAVSEANTRRILANQGCNKCPCCGETKTYDDYLKEGILNKGIFSGFLSKSWTKGLFRMRHMRCDCYICHTCGAEWESDPYEI